MPAEELAQQADSIDLDIAIALIDESPFNPRKHFDKAALGEMAETIKSRGVLERLKVRPKPGDRYELVFGARRLRAAKLAGLDSVPVVCQEMSDDEVRTEQAIENVQRVNPHPLEEADGYRELHQPPKGSTAAPRSVKEIAAAAGKSEDYVYRRMRLGALGPDARKAFFEGKIDLGVAEVLARIANPAIQKQALGDIDKGEQVTVQAMQKHVQHNYMLKLADAPFPTGDAKLVEKAGACSACPKNTSNERTLFADVGKDAMCTDPACYDSKMDAMWNQLAASAEEKGIEVVPAGKHKKIYPHPSSDRAAHDSGFVELDAQCYQDPKYRTYKQLLGKKAPLAIARDQQGGIHYLIPASKIPAALKEAGHDFKERTTGSAGVDQAEKRRRQAMERRRVQTGAVIDAVVKRVEEKVISATAGSMLFLDALMPALLDCGMANACSDLVARRKLKQKGVRAGDIVEELVEKGSHSQRAGIAIELAIGRSAYFSYSDKMHEHVVGAAKAVGLDPAKIAAAAVAELAEKREASKKPAKKKGKR